ncbi:methyltransferase domain-containing protein [Rhodobacterales bacterium HKCCE3408]|nr:methyltransferase domain-containing protein [Rhodobacterales bacterium HKCCE3408]
METFQEFADLELNGWTDDTISSGYVDMFAAASDMAIPEIVAAIRKRGKVLDLCCGQANVTEALAAAGHDVVGVDFSPKMLGHARRRVPTGTFIEADAQDLPFENGSFDTVVCSFGLMHVPDQPKALHEIRRVLKPGGQYVMTSWCGPDVSPVFQVFYGSVQEHGDPTVKLPDSPNFHQFANAEMARELLANAGLEIDEQRQVECYWDLDEPDRLANIFRRGAPRAGTLLKMQPEKNLAAIVEAVTEKTRSRFANGTSWRVPSPASLIVATAH